MPSRIRWIKDIFLFVRFPFHETDTYSRKVRSTRTEIEIFFVRQ
jgi:hypothetical protein